MSFFSFLFSPRGEAPRSHRPNLNVCLSLHGLEHLEDRIQPSRGWFSHGVQAQVGQMLKQVRSEVRSHGFNFGQLMRQLHSHSRCGQTNAASAAVSGAAFTDWNSNGTRDAGEDAETGVTVTLTGVDNQGNSVSHSVDTDANGNYSFTNLAAGTYSISFSSPSGTGLATVGSAGGSQNPNEPNTIDGIVLTSSTKASQYNFAVQPMGS